nr:hypothetical protein [Tanacetum cinerariifolium]
MKSWLVQKQTALGKDKSNPLTVDSLLKTIWSSIHHHITNEVLTIPGQMTTGKEISNLFMAGSLPKTIMTTFIHFWNTGAIKQDNDVTRLQALVNKKKVMVTKAAIREVLRLDDAEGVDCLPNEEIFAELARMGYEKPSTKLTLYKAFFSSHLVRNVDSTSKFYMYLHFIQLLIRKQVGVETPLFKEMIIEQEIKEGGDAEGHVEDVTAGDAAQGDDIVAYGEVPTVSQEPSIPSPTLPTPPPHPPQDLPSTSRVHHTLPQSPQDDVVALMDDKEEDKKEEEAKEDEPAKVQEVVDVVTTAKLITEVVTATSEIVTAASTIVSATEPQVFAATITAAPVRVVAASTRRRKGVVIRDPKEESTTSSIIPAETKSKDKGKRIMIEELKPLKKKK